MPSWLELIIRHGDLGVPVFFVLSGFVISHSLYAYRITTPVIWRFIIRRSVRLDPPYWAAITIAVVLAVASAKVVPGKSPPDFSFGQIAAHVLYIQDIAQLRPINTVFWTLSLEVQFYILYVLILAIGRNDPNQKYQGVAVLPLLLLTMTTSLLWPAGLVHSSLWAGSFLPQWHGFLLGVIAYWTWRNAEIAPLFLLFVSIAAGAGIATNNPFSITCSVVSLFLWIASLRNWALAWLASRLPQFLGSISYSLYLIHNPITGATFRAGYLATGHTLGSECLWWPISVLSCIAVAFVLWQTVERPSMALARRIRLEDTSMRPHRT